MSETDRRSSRPDNSSTSEDEAADVLQREVEQAVGHDVDDRVTRDAVDQHGSTFMSLVKANRLLITVTFALMVVVGVAASLALGSWWPVLVATLAHGTMATIVVTVGLRMTSQVEKPDPSTVARLEDAGLADPEGQMNQAIRAAAGEPEGHPEAQILKENERDPSKRADRGADAIVEQQLSTTPSTDSTKPQDKS